MARIYRGSAGGRKGRALGKWDERRQSPPTTMQNVTASYVRDGFTKEEAEREAREWQSRMDQRKAAIAEKQST